MGGILVVEPAPGERRMALEKLGASLSFRRYRRFR
jgi:hypothetical protein